MISVCNHKRKKLISQSLEGDKVFWISLVIMKHNKYDRVLHILHHAVEALVGLLWVARWGYLHGTLPLCVCAGQDPSNKHQPRSIRAWLRVGGIGRVTGVHSEIRPLTVCGR